MFKIAPLIFIFISLLFFQLTFSPRKSKFCEKIDNNCLTAYELFGEPKQSLPADICTVDCLSINTMRKGTVNQN